MLSLFLHTHTHTHTHIHVNVGFIQILAFWFLASAAFSLSFSPLLCFTFSFNTISPYHYDRFTVPLISVSCNYLVFHFYLLLLYTPFFFCVGAVGWDTSLQAGRSWVRFPLVSFELFIDIILPAALWLWGWLSLKQKWVSGTFPGG
jgi:hypothetical protein